MVVNGETCSTDSFPTMVRGEEDMQHRQPPYHGGYVGGGEATYPPSYQGGYGVYTGICRVVSLLPWVYLAHTLLLLGPASTAALIEVHRAGPWGSG